MRFKPVPPSSLVPPSLILPLLMVNKFLLESYSTFQYVYLNHLSRCKSRHRDMALNIADKVDLTSLEEQWAFQGTFDEVCK